MPFAIDYRKRQLDEKESRHFHGTAKTRFSNLNAGTVTIIFIFILPFQLFISSQAGFVGFHCFFDSPPGEKE